MTENSKEIKMDAKFLNEKISTIQSRIEIEASDMTPKQLNRYMHNILIALQAILYKNGVYMPDNIKPFGVHQFEETVIAYFLSNSLHWDLMIIPEDDRVSKRNDLAFSIKIDPNQLFSLLDHEEVNSHAHPIPVRTTIKDPRKVETTINLADFTEDQLKTLYQALERTFYS